MRNLTADYIPCIRTQAEHRIVSSIMDDADVVRISSHEVDNLGINPKWRLWSDPSFDGYDFVFDNGWYRNEGGAKHKWSDWIRGFPGHDLLTSVDSAADASQSDIDSFVARVLDSVAADDPAIISVPQIPYTQEPTRQRINKKLAKAAGKWKEGKWSGGTFVLPVILKHHEVYRTRTVSRPKINAICRSLEFSRATGLWVVHADFDDLAGVSKYDRERFPSLIRFHEQLNEALPAKTFTCAGPYWAINLVLWARGIVDVAVISGGGVYYHSLPKPLFVKGKAITRIALPPLRRCYVVNRELRTWVKAAKSRFPPRNDIRESLQQIEASFGQFLGPGGRTPSMRQTSQFYHSWRREIAAIEPRGRGLFLFQDFSKAVVNGAHIGTKLPKQGQLSSEARNPGFIAEQFMLQCLPR